MRLVSADGQEKATAHHPGGLAHEAQGGFATERRGAQVGEAPCLRGAGLGLLGGAGQQGRWGLAGRDLAAFVQPPGGLEQDLVRVDALHEQEVAGIDLDVAAVGDVEALELEEPGGPPEELLDDGTGLVLHHVLEGLFVQLAHLEEDLAQPLGLMPPMLVLERFHEGRLGDEPAAHQQVAEGLADRVRRGVEDAPDAHQDDTVAASSAQGEPARLSVVGQELDQLGELDVLEPAHQAHRRTPRLGHGWLAGPAPSAPPPAWGFPRAAPGSGEAPLRLPATLRA